MLSKYLKGVNTFPWETLKQSWTQGNPGTQSSSRQTSLSVCTASLSLSLAACPSPGQRKGKYSWSCLHYKGKCELLLLIKHFILIFFFDHKRYPTAYFLNDPYRSNKQCFSNKKTAPSVSLVCHKNLSFPILIDLTNTWWMPFSFVPGSICWALKIGRKSKHHSSPPRADSPGRETNMYAATLMERGSGCFLKRDREREKMKDGCSFFLLMIQMQNHNPFPVWMR